MVKSVRLKKLIVKNFKSLKDCEIELGKLNILVGPNASGKTNLVEVFKLLRKIYVEKDINPFLDWWGYNNIVWGGKEELPITIGILFDVDGYEVYFETTFTGAGGSFRILREVLEIREYITIERVGSHLTVKYSTEWIGRFISSLPLVTEEIFEIFSSLAINEEYKYLIPPDAELKSILDLCVLSEGIYSQDKRISYQLCYLSRNDFGLKRKALPMVFPTLNRELPGLLGVNSTIMRLFEGTLTLRQIYLHQLRIPKFPRKEMALNSDASNLIPLLYNIWLREGRLPDEIAEPLSIAFPNTKIFFQLTEDGRVMMKIFEDGLELSPPGISDGFYKTLAILTAIYLKPPLLIIDEIENSLHPETLELIIDTLRESESQVIITTHSPVVVDLIEPSELILVDKRNDRTIFKRVKNPKKIKEFLNKKGLALSEGWLYGSIFENEKQ